MEEQPVCQQRSQLYRQVRRMTPPPPPSRTILAPKQQEGRSATFEVTLRVLLFVSFFVTENMKPFERVIQPEEIWLYRYPVPEKSYFEQVGGRFLQLLLDPLPMISYCIIVIFVKLCVSGNPIQARQAAYAFLLALPVTGTVVNTLKNIAGRPRPDFMARCYGPYYYLRYNDMSRTCYNEDFYAQDGRKSFPSGHSALAACCFGFLALYLAGQMGSFQERARNKITSVIITVPILLLPVIIAISRTCDYRHHWQDVTVGLLIGFAITYLSYRVYFPSLSDKHSHLPYICIPYSLEMCPLPHTRPVYSSDEDEDDDGNYSDDGFDRNENSVPMQLCQGYPRAALPSS